MTYRIVVLVKQTPDMNSLRVDRTTGLLATSGQLAMNAGDEYAVEAALQIKESSGANITVVSAGPTSVKDVVSRALAMGADRGVIVDLGGANQHDSLAVAMALADAIKPIGFDILLAGYNSDDVDTAQVVPQVAEMLGVPLVSSVTDLKVDGNQITAQRDMEDGKQTVTAHLPVAITAIAGLNEPRYPSLKGIMAAKKKPVETVAAVFPAGERLQWGTPTAPERQSSGILLQDLPATEAAQQLVAWLRSEKLV